MPAAQDADPVGPSALDELGALDVDGVQAARWGTAAWGVGLVITFALRGRLAETGSAWWVWVCLAGFLGGVVGTVYVTHRRDALRRAASRPGRQEWPRSSTS